MGEEEKKPDSSDKKEEVKQEAPSTEQTEKVEQAKEQPQEEKPKETPKKEEPEEDEIVIDFSKVKKMFKGDEKKPEEKKKESKSEEKEDDDEVVIDFSKIGKMFKGDEKKESSKSASTEEKEDDDDVAIDFSQMKSKFTGMFNKDKKSEPQEKNDDEFNIDWATISAFMRKRGTLILFLLALLIPVGLSIDVRMQSANYPITDNWAQDAVINNVRAQIAGQINQQYPNLPQANRDGLINAELQRQLEQNWDQIKPQVDATSNFYKQHLQDPNGVGYMPDIDTYYWMRYAENILDHGYPGDELRDGKSLDNKQLAPEGRLVFPDMYPAYFIAYFHSFIGLFVPGISLVKTMSFYPVFITAIATALIFLIGRRITNNVGGFFAALIFAVHSTLLGRTLYGHADSDAWVIFFPILVTWLIFEVFERKRLLSACLLGAAAGVAVGFFSFSWLGWWYIFDFVLIAVGGHLAYYVFSNFSDFRSNWKEFIQRKEVKHVVLATIIFVLVSFAGVSTALNPKDFLNGALGPLTFSNIKSPVSANLWPNVLTTVAELNTGSFNQVVGSVGGKFMFYFAVLGIILTLFVRNNQGKRDIKSSILLALWFVATSYATLKGIRFTLLLAPAFAVAFGTTIGILYAFFTRWISKELKINKMLISVVLIGLFIFMIFTPIKGAYGAAKGDLPIVNDVWYNSLKAIQANSTEDAIITSWWDFGHHFKQIADRPVTFDGTTQTHPAARWVGKLFMISDERESQGILRMLDCGSNNAFDHLVTESRDTVEAVETLDSILVVDKDEARQILHDKGISEETTEAVLENTHCTPTEGFVIASGDMIGKSGVWSHFGSWNFIRADLWFNVRNMPVAEAVAYMQERYNYTSQEAENIYFEMKGITTDQQANQWVAPWPGYGGTTTCTDRTDTNVYACDNGFTFNYTSKEAYAFQQTTRVHPNRVAYVTREGLDFQTYDQNTIGAGITFVPTSENQMLGIVSSPELVGSLFTRMFYMNGHGLHYFDRFYNERGLIGTDVQVYKADWEGQSVYIYEPYVELLDLIEFGPPEVEEIVIDLDELLANNQTNATV